MRNFKLKDIEGAGHYLVRQDKKEDGSNVEHISRTGYLTTIMYKIGYMHGSKTEGQVTCLISMADGWTQDSHYVKDPEDPKNASNWEEVKWVSDRLGTKQKGRDLFLDHLNKGETEYRFATREEVVRCVMHQHWRVKEYYDKNNPKDEE
jgi:hypothetical protein